MMSTQILLSPVGLALFILYFSLSLFTGSQIIRMVYYRHKLRSFQMGFRIQLFIWALLRAVYFAFYNLLENSIIADAILYWLPFNIQFSTFSFMVVFFAHLQHKHKSEWKSFKRWYITAWITINVIFYILGFVWVGLDCFYDDKHHGNAPEWLVEVHLYFNGGVFFVLDLLLAWYGWKLAQMMTRPEGPQVKLIAKISVKKVVAVTFTLFLLFASRCLFDLISASYSRVSLSITNDLDAILTFVLLCLWEVIPTMLVLILIGTVPSSALGAFSKQPQRHVHPHTRPRRPSETSSLLKTQLFNDPRRYDSDEESPLFKGSPLLYGGTTPGSYASPGAHIPISINDATGTTPNYR